MSRPEPVQPDGGPTQPGRASLPRPARLSQDDLRLRGHVRLPPPLSSQHGPTACLREHVIDNNTANNNNNNNDKENDNDNLTTGNIHNNAIMDNYDEKATAEPRD